MATVVSFISEKGGVGKTTTCYHVAVGLNRFHGKRVLVLDVDYQRGGISGRFFPDVIENFDSGEIAGTTLFHKFQQLYSASRLTPEIDVRNWPYGQSTVDVITADPRLSTVTVDKLPSSNNIKANNLQLLQHLQVISFVLQEISDNYDYILVDSHPEVSDVLRSVIFASDYCVSPAKLDRQSSVGVSTILAQIRNVNADIEMLKAYVEDFDYKDTVFAGSIGMMTREHDGTLKQSERTEYNILQRTGGVFKSYVTEGDGLRQAAADHIPVYDVTIANAEKQSYQFISLVEEFLEKCP